MVNASKVLKRRSSKRQSLHDKHKIEKKVREHHRKERRDAKRNPQLHRKKKDPGIPNSWPFKQQMIQQAVRHATAPSLRPSNGPNQYPQPPSHSRRSLPACAGAPAREGQGVADQGARGSQARAHGAS